jgi:Ala-tRNA(Pro) deacylase
MEYHPVVEKIKTLLTQNSCWFETFEHPPVRTSEEAAKTRVGYTIQQGAKAIIARVKESGKGKRFVMIVLPGDKRFNSQKVSTLFNFTDIRFASEVEVGEITGGVLPGGVPPFGNLFNLEVFADDSLLANEKIVFNAGDKSYSVGMKSEDYIKLVLPKIASFVE